MRGLPPCYWRVIVARWMDRAFVCRYGNQNIFQLMGRDPCRQPLTPIELALFTACVQDHTMEERKPFVELGIPPPE